MRLTLVICFSLLYSIFSMAQINPKAKLKLLANTDIDSYVFKNLTAKESNVEGKFSLTKIYTELINDEKYIAFFKYVDSDTTGFIIDYSTAHKGVFITDDQMNALISKYLILRDSISMRSSIRQTEYFYYNVNDDVTIFTSNNTSDPTGKLNLYFRIENEMYPVTAEIFSSRMKRYTETGGLFSKEIPNKIMVYKNVFWGGEFCLYKNTNGVAWNYYVSFSADEMFFSKKGGNVIEQCFIEYEIVEDKILGELIDATFTDITHIEITDSSIILFSQFNDILGTLYRQ